MNTEPKNKKTSVILKLPKQSAKKLKNKSQETGKTISVLVHEMIKSGGLAAN